MKYKEQVELVRDLRELADFLERPESIALPSLYVGSFSASANVGKWGTDPVTHKYGYQVDEYETRTRMRNLARLMKPVEKNYSGESFSLDKKFGSLKLHIYTKREAICRAVKTGEVKHYDEVVLPARTEEVVEWVCDDPILAAS